MQSVSVGDLVIRKSHGGDIVFKVADVFCDESGKVHCMLKGMHLRLMADAPAEDLEPVDAIHLRQEIKRFEDLHNDSLRRILQRRAGHLAKDKGKIKEKEGDPKEAKESKDQLAESLKKSFFDLPGRVLHLDGDEEYLKMCLKTYRQLKMEAVGHWMEEAKQPEVVAKLIKEVRPEILVLTGHDALIGGGKRDYKDINNYRTSKYFVQSVLNAREVRPSLDSLVIFAGACQSHFEAILEAGANFASSPLRVFIHAYDPVFVAEKVAYTSIEHKVDIAEAIAASVTGVEGVGGVETRGKFRKGMPVSPY